MRINFHYNDMVRNYHALIIIFTVVYVLVFGPLGHFHVTCMGMTDIDIESKISLAIEDWHLIERAGRD